MPDGSIIKKLKLLEVIWENDNARTLVMEPLDGWRPQYEAGQFITLVFATKHGEKRRSYSLVSDVEKDKLLRITVKKIDNGEFSRPLVYNAKPGDIFYTSGISGRFTLREPANGKTFCFLAAGSGITPCYSLIQALLAGSGAQIVLLYSNRNRADSLFIPELSRLQQQHPQRFRMHLLFSDQKDLRYGRLSKSLLEQLLNEYLPADSGNTRVYLCGPFDYMQMAEIVLLTRISREHIVRENFSSLPRIVLPEPPDKSAHEVTINTQGRRHRLMVQYPKSVLKTAIENKIALPYSCQAGRCASCIATCTNGKMWLAYNEVLVDSELAAGRILTCQAFPVNGDAEITFDQ